MGGKSLKGGRWGPIEYIALVGSIALYLARLPLLRLRYFDADEFEHIHAAFLVHQGQVPYRDFFELHTPALYFFLAPLFGISEVGSDSEQAISFLFGARSLSWLLSGLILFMVYRIWQHSAGRTVGLLSVLFLSATGIFEQKTLEVRPDLISVGLELIALIFLIRAEKPPGRPRWLAASGFCLGLGVLTSQKILFLVPGVALFLWTAYPRARGRSVGTFLGGFGLPFLLMGAFFFSQGALQAFLRFGFLFSFGYQYRFSPWGYLGQWFQENPFLFLLGWGGFFYSLMNWRNTRGRFSDRLLLSISASWALGLFLIPVPYRQYYLMGLPLWAGHAARALIKLTPKSGVTPALVAVAALANGGWLYYQDALKQDPTQLPRIQAVMRLTGSEEEVFDGLTGGGVFRKHAWFYFALQDQIFRMIPEEERNHYKLGLRTGTLRPSLILWDEHLDAFLRDSESEVKAQYLPYSMELQIWKRRASHETH